MLEVATLLVALALWLVFLAWLAGRLGYKKDD